MRKVNLQFLEAVYHVFTRRDTWHRQAWLNKVNRSPTTSLCMFAVQMGVICCRHNQRTAKLGQKESHTDKIALV